MNLFNLKNKTKCKEKSSFNILPIPRTKLEKKKNSAFNKPWMSKQREESKTKSRQSETKIKIK